jgi:hypothetical protein
MVRCEVEGCPIKNACFNMEGEKKGRRCSKHRLEGMVDIQDNKCDDVTDGIKCKIKRTFGFSGQKAKKCKKHKEDSMIHIGKKCCDFAHPETKVKCTTTPNFGFEGQKAIKCFDHKLLGMIDLNNKKCDGKDLKTGQLCTRRPTYGYHKTYEGDLHGYGKEKIIKCKFHILENMVNVVSLRCEICDKLPVFGFKKSKKEEGGGPRRCKDHKLPGMWNVVNKKCCHKEGEEQCKKLAKYSFPGDTPSCCKDHKKDGMEKTHKAKCEYANCITCPSFNLPGLTPRFCLKHKTDDMVNVNGHMCQTPGCGTRATYNFPTEKKGKHCMKHALAGMVDVIHNKCQDCPNRAFFGIPGDIIPRKCKVHKSNTMVKIGEKERPKCENCDLPATFGSLFGMKRHCGAHKLAHEYERNNPYCKVQECKNKACCSNNGSNYPDRCDPHALPDDVNIVEKECGKCNLKYLLNDKTGLCDTCNDVVIKNIQKSKENETVLFLKNKGINFLSTDKIPENACSRYRPDAVIDFLHFIVIVEVDEYQHKTYTKECEKMRMMQIHQDYGGIPVVFIRFNPDNYNIRLPNGSKEVVKPSNGRLTELFDLIKRFEYLKSIYESSPLAPLTVCYLFYNGYTGNPQLEAIDIYEEVKVKPKLKLKILG